MAERTSMGRAKAGAIVFSMMAAVFVGVILQVASPVDGVTYTLYGSAIGGWGFTPGTISSPGPTLTVTRFEAVDLTLNSADGLPHTWCIDYDGDNACALSGENESTSFTTVPIVWSFVPTGAPGTYRYVCGFHLGTIMNGQITILPPVRPVVSVTSPTGGQRWTGGSTHPVVWSMTDPQDPVTSLRAWVNYSDGVTTVPIAGPIVGSANPHSVPWTLPLVNTTTASVNVTVVDPSRNRAWAVQPVPTIDSAPPSVVGRVPANGAVGVSTATNVIITFDEGMNPTATGSPGSVALQDTVTLGWIPVTYGWSGGSTVLTVNPVSNLASFTMYRASVNVSALDASDPGNNLSAAAAWVFTTGCCADLERPAISNVTATPSVAEFGTATVVSATITDNHAVAAAFANVTYPDSTVTNRSMAVVSGTTWGRSEAYPQLGDYLFRVGALDPTGNWNRSAQGTFRVRDTTVPAISGLAVTPSPAEVYEPANITVAASDPFLGSVGIDLSGANTSMSFDATSGKWFRVFTPTAVQTYPFVIWAGDSSGNLASLPGQVQSVDTKAPPLPQGLVATLIGDAAVEVRWSTVSAPDLAGYKLYRSTSPSGPFTSQVGPSVITGNAFIDRGVQPGATYYYAVTSVDTGRRESAQSVVASVTLPAAPADYTIPIIAGVAIAVIVAVLAAILVLRRRRKGA